MMLKCITCLRFGGCIYEWRTVGKCPKDKKEEKDER